MRIWRLEKTRYVSSAFRRQGSLKTGGRWHRRGTQVAYTSEHPAVAALEKLAWLGSHEAAQQSDYVLLSLLVDPDRHVETWPDEDLPSNWDRFPHPRSTQEIGTKWAQEERSVILAVPSATMPVSQNYLINPFHPHFQELQPGDPIPFSWDSRLFSTRQE